MRKLCARFPGEYWRALDRERKYPTEFVATLTREGFLSVLIPEEFGGSGLGLGAATAVLEEIHRSGCNGGACHAQMYTMGTILRHGSAEQKKRYLPEDRDRRIAASGLRRHRTDLRHRHDAHHDLREARGRQIRRQRPEDLDLPEPSIPISWCCSCARRRARQSKKPTDGMSVLLVDLREAVGNGLTIRPVRTMINHATTELFFDDLEVPAENLIGEENEGFRYIIDGMNAERILIAAECIGDGRFFIDRASAYAKERQVFGRPIGENQGIQFPIARASCAGHRRRRNGRQSGGPVRCR